MKACFFLPILGFNFLSAKEISYSQNNPSQQNEYKNRSEDHRFYYENEDNRHDLNKRHNIIFNAALLWGKISPSTIPSINQVFSETKNFYYRSSAELGFRIGAGVSFENMFNLSLQYSWMRSKGSQSESGTMTSSDIMFVVLLNGNDFPFPGSNLSVYEFDNQEKINYQTLDLLLQTSVWKMNQNVIFQPFCGIRYFYYQRKIQTNAIGSDQQLLTITLSTNGIHKIHATGLFGGTDIKYLFLRNWHFFSSTYLGILAGQTQTNSNTMIDNSATTIANRTEFNFMPFANVQFGIAWEKVFKSFLISIHLGYELSTMVHPGAFGVNITTPTRFAEKVVNTQVGFLGAMIQF